MPRSFLATRSASTHERPAPRPRCAAGYGEYPAQNLWAKWEQLFRRFSPASLVRVRSRILCEASQRSARTVESPFIRFLFSLLSFFGKMSGVFSQALRLEPPPQFSPLPPPTSR